LKGFQALQQHAVTSKHISNYKDKLGEKQLHLSASLPTTSTNIELNIREKNNIRSLFIQTSSRDLATKAELIWTMKTVISNMSAASSDGISQIFKSMFPESFVNNSFSLNRTKLSYLITDSLGPYFRQILLDECQNTYYTLIYDETTNDKGAKELQCAIRYWSNAVNEVVVHHLETFFIGTATGQILEEYIMKALNNGNIPIEKLLMLGSDGPNVNKKVFRLVNENVKLIRGKSLIDIGTCNIHIIHNSFLKGLEYMGNRVSDFIIDIYYFFHGWPKRGEDYLKIQKDKGLSEHKFLKHCSSRWLTLSSAAALIIEQWIGISEYFIKFIPNHQKSLIHTLKFKKIIDCLKCSAFQAELEFVFWSASIFQRFTGRFQRQEPLIHIMYEELSQLVCIIVGYVCKENVISEWLKHNAFDLFSEVNLRDIIDLLVHLPNELKIHLNNLNELDKNIFLRKHLVSAGNHILNKSSIKDSSKLKYFRCLKIDEIKKSRSSIDINKIASIMPFKVDCNKLVDEWKLLRFESLPNTSARIDHFWNNIFDLKSGLGEIKYPIVTQVVKACLTLSHGSAEVERGFSKSGNILTDDKSAMSCRMLNGRLNIQDGLSRYNKKPELVPMTKELLLSARLAHSKYVNFLEESKKKKTEQENQQKLKEEEERLRMEEEKQLINTKENIVDLEKQYLNAKKVEEKQKKAVDTFLEEATERLQKAIDSNDLVNAQVAVGMLDAEKKLRD